jgi:ferritin
MLERARARAARDADRTRELRAIIDELREQHRDTALLDDLLDVFSQALSEERGLVLFLESQGAAGSRH